MLIGITGTDGAGKGAVVKYLVKQKGYTHYSGRAFISEEVAKRGGTADRSTLRLVANDMRREHGNDVLVQKAITACDAQGVTEAVVESIRTTAEVETLRSEGGVLLAIDAAPRVRYRRISGRGAATDKISFEQFQKQEAIEMNDPDPNGMQKAKVMEMADYTILNEKTLKDLYTEVDAFLEKFTL